MTPKSPRSAQRLAEAMAWGSLSTSCLHQPLPLSWSGPTAASQLAHLAAQPRGRATSGETLAHREARCRGRSWARACRVSGAAGSAGRRGSAFL